MDRGEGIVDTICAVLCSSTTLLSRPGELGLTTSMVEKVIQQQQCNLVLAVCLAFIALNCDG